MTESLHLVARVDGVRIAHHTCTPAPEPDTPAMDACLEAFADKVEEALGEESPAGRSTLELASDLDGAPLFVTSATPVPTPGTSAWSDLFRLFQRGTEAALSS